MLEGETGSVDAVAAYGPNWGALGEVGVVDCLRTGHDVALDRIWLAAVLLDLKSDDDSEPAVFETLVNPRIPIPAEATFLHGIATVHCGGPTELDVAMDFYRDRFADASFTGDGEFSLEESMVIGAMAGILQTRLRERLREELGGTCSVGVSGSISYRPDEEYRVGIQFGSDPRRAEEPSAAVFEEIERLKDTVPTRRWSTIPAKRNGVRWRRAWCGTRTGSARSLNPSFNVNTQPISGAATFARTHLQLVGAVSSPPASAG